jgi:hypothetical protein
MSRVSQNKRKEVSAATYLTAIINIEDIKTHIVTAMREDLVPAKCLKKYRSRSTSTKILTSAKWV